jgi:FixJ family two-component response regulator
MNREIEVNDNEQMSAKPLIAIVDDDRSVRESLQFLLRSAGYIAESFASAREFLDAVRHNKTACVILDVRLPGMDGLELQRCLNAGQQKIPIIFITAQATESEEQRARKAGAVDFLRKPMNDKKLFGAIRTALKGWGNDERMRL